MNTSNYIYMYKDKHLMSTTDIWLLSYRIMEDIKNITHFSCLWHFFALHSKVSSRKKLTHYRQEKRFCSNLYKDILVFSIPLFL